MATRNGSITLRKGNSETNEIYLDYPRLRKGVLLLRAVGHDLRKSIITLLKENKSMTVTELYQTLQLEQSVASQHLAELRKAGVVKTVREGKHIHYSLNKDRIKAINTITKEISKEV